MKNIINTILMASLSAAMTAYIGNYEEINYDHYGPGSGDVLADDYALGSAMNNLAGCVISPDVNTAQFTDCLLGGTMGGYFADSQNTWTNTISNYNPTDDWTRVFLKSDKVIPVLYTNYNAVKDYFRTRPETTFVPTWSDLSKIHKSRRATASYTPDTYWWSTLRYVINEVGRETGTELTYLHYV